MVASKLAVDKSSEDYQCGDNSKFTTNFDVNQSRNSSYDDSTKCKSENESPEKLSLDDSINNESDNNKCLSSTYICCRRKVSVNSNSIGDSKIENIEETSYREKSNSDEEICCSPDNITLKYRNLFSISNSLNPVQWNSELSDLQLDSLTVEESKLIDENEDDSPLLKIRKWLVQYQESRGTSREEYTFFTLIRIMGQATGRCLLALFYVILNVAPVLEIFLHIMRFVLDKMIDIKKTPEAQQIVAKCAIFCLQMLSVYVCLIFIFGFIVSPILRMGLGILTKIMLYE